VDDALCRRQIWQATQQMQLQGSYRREVRLALAPGLASARARRRLREANRLGSGGGGHRRAMGRRQQRAVVEGGDGGRALSQSARAVGGGGGTASGLKLPPISQSARSAGADGGGGAAAAPPKRTKAVRQAFPSWMRSIWTEVYLCRTCSCQEILRMETPGQAPRRPRQLTYPEVEEQRRAQQEEHIVCELRRRAEDREAYEAKRQGRWDVHVKPWMVEREKVSAPRPQPAHHPRCGSALTGISCRYLDTSRGRRLPIPRT
jgi:hypothetical protein